MRAWGLLLAVLLPAAHAGDDDALARRGRALYQGAVAYARGSAVTSQRLPAEFVACARCHGAAGQGGREGGQVVPPLRWSSLTQPRAAQAALADAAAVARAITQGQGRGGRTLDALMPRFDLQPDEQRALLAYLRRVGTEADLPPGVSAGRIRLGALVPLGGAARATGEAIVAGLRAGIAPVNARGGIHGRRIELDVQDVRPGVRAALSRWEQNPVYALVGGLWSERAERADALLAAARLSHVAALVARDRALRPTDWSADLLAPASLQRTALAQALDACAGGDRVGVLHAGASPESADGAGEGVRWLPAGPRLTEALHQAGSGCIGYPLADAPAVQGALAALGPSGDRWSSTLVLPMPAALLQAQGAASSPWYRLGLAAAELTAELLSRAGRVLHERSLLDQLDRLPELELPSGVAVQFGRQRRHAWAPLLVPLGSPRQAAQPLPLASRGGS